MNETIIKEIATTLKITDEQVRVVLNLLSLGNTVPFIARYRKEATGALNEEIIRQIDEVYQYQVNLLKRKEDVIRLIEEKGLLTKELKSSILSASKLVEVEDLYRPYKEKKKTKATDAIKLGLEPLAKLILTFPKEGTIDDICKPYVNDKVKSKEEAIEGAKYIISENISDVALYRKYLRTNIFIDGTLVSKKKKKAIDEAKTYEMYYDYSEPLKNIKLHRVMAIDRGEKEDVLSVNIDYDIDKYIKYLEDKIIKDHKSFVNSIVSAAIEDSLKRLILPSIEREIRSELKDKAEVVSIDNFAKNLEALLLTPPIKEKVVLGVDPAFRTGCKLAVLDKTGKVLEIAVIYPTEPHNDIEGSKKIVLDLINKYDVDVIAIGNGTASRETEAFIANIIKECNREVSYIIVSEAGASVYSASKLAIGEFPDLTVEKRSAISIGRRLQDALAELVKIDPESIGVGLYQHDVKEKNLSEALNFTVLKCVNNVGVNINTASISLLSYVSGLTKKISENIIKYRDKKGKFNNRSELLKVSGINDKVYEQAVGFMRILDGDNSLDKTSIHPESYAITLKLLAKYNLSVTDIGTDKLKEALKDIDISSLSKELDTDTYTIEDIIKALMAPTRDPRDMLPKPMLRSDILHIEDLHIGDKLQGTVRNVVDFGLFIDIGLKNDGLAHISKLTNHYLKHPSDLFSVGDIVDCYVDDVSIEKKKVSLSLLPLK